MSNLTVAAAIGGIAVGVGVAVALGGERRALGAASSCDPNRLPFIERETWDDGTVVVYRKHPFPVRHKPIVPSRLVDTAEIETVPLSKINGSQRVVVERGLCRSSEERGKSSEERARSERGASEDLPLVYAEQDGTFTVGDGHHRLTTAWLLGRKSARVRVVRS